MWRKVRKGGGVGCCGGGRTVWAGGEVVWYSIV